MEEPYLKKKRDGDTIPYNFYEIQKAFQKYEKKFDRIKRIEDFLELMKKKISKAKMKGSLMGIVSLRDGKIIWKEGYIQQVI